MLLNKVLSQMAGSASISTQKIADQLFEDIVMIKLAITHLCRLDYCQKVTPFTLEGSCKGGCANSCTAIFESRTTYWSLTSKGLKYLKKL